MTRTYRRPRFWFGTAGLLAGLVLLIGSCGEYAPAQVDALVTAPIVKQGTCASGFTRTAPNFCTRTSVGGSSYSVTGSCDAVTFAEVPANATSILLGVTLQLVSADAVGNHTAQLNAYQPSDTTCSAGIVMASTLSLREFVAVSPAGTTIGLLQDTMLVPAADGQARLRFTLLGAGNHIVSAGPRGYYD